MGRIAPLSNSSNQKHTPPPYLRTLTILAVNSFLSRSVVHDLMLLAEDIKTIIEVAAEPNEVGGGVTWEGMRMVDKAARAAVVGTRARVAEAGLHQEEGDRG